MGLEQLAQSNAAGEIAEQAQPADQFAPSEEMEPTEEDLLKLLEDDPIEGVEKPVAPVKPIEEPETEEPLSAKFAELAKMESKYQKQLREMKEENEKLKGNSENKLTKDELLEQLRGEYKKNPKRFLEEKLSGSYDELSDFILNEEDKVKEYESNERVGGLEAKLKALTDKLETKEQTEKEGAYNDKVDKFKSDIKGYMSSKGEDYGIINSLGEEETVYDVMQEYFEKNGKTLDIDEACAQVEDYYVKKIQALSGLAKVKNIFNVDNSTEIKKQVAPQAPSDEESQQFNGVNTITNDFVSEYSESDLENMSDEERMRLAESLL